MGGGGGGGHVKIIPLPTRVAPKAENDCAVHVMAHYQVQCVFILYCEILIQQFNLLMKCPSPKKGNITYCLSSLPCEQHVMFHKQ